MTPKSDHGGVQHEYIDIYCERVGTEFWAEPLNAVSNLGFIVAAALLILTLQGNQRGRQADASTRVLIAIVILIGVGSGLFHTFAVRWAMWADILPITAFIVAYCYLALRRYLYLEAGASTIWTASILILTAGLPALTHLRASTYVPALFGMFVVAIILRARRRLRAVTSALVVSGCLFALSLVFRTLDAPLCDFFPSGTHFLWHLLNAVMLYILIRTMIHIVADAAGRRHYSHDDAIT
ncbi:MAG: ceramidase domain-containing protein [Planctomycetota bacterium]